MNNSYPNDNNNSANFYDNNKYAHFESNVYH